MDKFCRKCKKIKCIDEFSRDKIQIDGHRRICKECKNQENKLYRKKYPFKDYNYKANKVYNITPREYSDFVKKQDGKCAICKTADKNFNNQRLSIDHDHKTNKIRGLLCNKCNRGMGLLNDDVSVLENAINYLKNNK